jgi:hypothetical protein
MKAMEMRMAMIEMNEHVQAVTELLNRPEQFAAWLRKQTPLLDFMVTCYSCPLAIWLAEAYGTEHGVAISVAHFDVELRHNVRAVTPDATVRSPYWATRFMQLFDGLIAHGCQVDDNPGDCWATANEVVNSLNQTKPTWWEVAQ